MSVFHVVFPVQSFLQVDRRYDTLFEMLSRRNAVVHLMNESMPLPDIYLDFDVVKAQQMEIMRMKRGYCMSMLRRAGHELAQRYPDIRFEYHVSPDPLPFLIGALNDRFGVQLLVMDKQDLLQSLEAGTYRLQQLAELIALPIWLVGQATPSYGDVLVALDLPSYNPQDDRLNRNLIELGQQVAEDQHGDVVLTHCWQQKSAPERDWLAMNDLEVARFTRFEKRQLAEQMLDYAEQMQRDGVRLHRHVAEGAMERSIPAICRARAARLVMIGHHEHRHDALDKKALEIIRQVDCDALMVPRLDGRLPLLDFDRRAAHPQAQRQRR